jgi:hypothetical protein
MPEEVRRSFIVRVLRMSLLDEFILTRSLSTGQ